MRILIIEDEPKAASRLNRMVTELAPDMEVIAMLDSVEGSLTWLAGNEAPDLILMDIQLADGSSFEIFDHHVVDSPVIFTTAYDEYALKAFKHNSIDYLLKPIKREELTLALNKFQRLHKQHKNSDIDYNQLANQIQIDKPSYQKRILIRYAQTLKAVEIADAAYFYIESRITFMRTFDGKNYPVDYNLDQLEGILNPALFFRINRKYIIHVKAIAEMYTWSKSRVKIILNPTNEMEALVSSERSASFKKWLTGAEQQPS